MKNTFEQLEKEFETFNQKVSQWFVDELAKWSKKHNMYIEDYGIVRMWVIGSDEKYEPYHHPNSDLDEQFTNALKDYEKLVDDASFINLRTWQGMEYSNKHKFIH